MKAAPQKQLIKRLDKLQTGVASLSAAIEKGDDSTATLKRAAALVTSAKELHADLARDCLAQVLTDPATSGGNAEAILQHLRALLR
jgi:DNA-binding FrmR family transcriptional regulator